ncbi:FecR domain-containing protein [Pseudanabaenaceae cyanobacterium LEGE 13415]|nr:FecR domain-containing protein [Pseudanabaenaceae cyanobacterium LEGE 13415]
MKAGRNLTNAQKTATIGGLLFLSIVGFISIVQAREIRVRVNRWLSLQQLTGQVSLFQGGNSRAARSGDRLQAVGDGVSTGRNSRVALAIDLGIGQVNVSERTRVIIRALESTANGGRVTRLAVPTGRVQLRVRPFSSPDSQLEIETPAGVAGVRGTQFGINVQRNGKMSIATREGRVASIAQGQNVLVNSGFQNFTIPGEPPSEPVPLRDDTTLRYEFVKRLDQGVRRLRLVGQVDVVNSVLVNGVEQNTDRNGRFSVELDAISFPVIQVTVATPLGRQQDYDLAFR